MQKPRKRRPAAETPPDTKHALIAAAGGEFNTLGYFGTDTNRIARRAGFAPQTFYRHFTDKLDVFVVVYEQWRADEAKALGAAIRSATTPAQRAKAAADVFIQFHRDWATFRRSLRLLALEQPTVRAARAKSRAKQIELLARLHGNADRTRASLFASVLEIERLCDAIADLETDDLGIRAQDWRIEIARAAAVALGQAS